MRKNIILAGITVVVAGIIMEVIAFIGNIQFWLWEWSLWGELSPIIVIFLLGIALVLVGFAVIVIGLVLKQKTTN